MSGDTKSSWVVEFVNLHPNDNLSPSNAGVHVKSWREFSCMSRKIQPDFYTQKHCVPVGDYGSLIVVSLSVEHHMTHLVYYGENKQDYRE